MSLASIVYPQLFLIGTVSLYSFFARRENLLQLAVFSRYPIKEEHLIIYPDSKNCSLACDIEINGRNHPPVQQSSPNNGSKPEQAQTGKGTSYG